MNVICGACGRGVGLPEGKRLDLAKSSIGGFRCKCGMVYQFEFKAVETPLRAARRMFTPGVEVEPRDGQNWSDILPGCSYVSPAVTVRVVEVTGWRDSEDDPVVLVCVARHDGPFAVWVTPSMIQRKEGE